MKNKLLLGISLLLSSQMFAQEQETPKFEKKQVVATENVEAKKQEPLKSTAIEKKAIQKKEEEVNKSQEVK